MQLERPLELLERLGGSPGALAQAGELEAQVGVVGVLGQRAAELGLPVLLHPAKPLTTEFVKGYEMTSSLGNMFDNTIALTRLLMSGLLDELPKLKLVCPHLGGTLPYISGRMDHQVTVLKRSTQTLQRKPSEYLRDIYMDIVSPLPEAIRRS